MTLRILHKGKRKTYALLNLNAMFLTLFVLTAPSCSSSSFCGSTKSTGATLIDGDQSELSSRGVYAGGFPRLYPSAAAA